MRSQIPQKNNVNALELVNYLHLFWQHKWKAIIITLICLLFAVFYIRFSTPVFEARGFIYPPSLGNISSLNLNYSLKNSLGKQKDIVEDAYGVFAYYLLANSTKKVFATEALSSTEKSTEKQMQQALTDFNKTLTIRTLPGMEPIKFLITAKGKDPEQTVNWVEKYLALANTRAVNEIIGNIQIQKEKAINDLQNKIEAIRETTNNLTNKNLEDKFLSSSLIKLQSQLNYYKKINVEPENVFLFRLDGKLEKPSNPVFPRKMLILILAFSLGLFLSMVVILMQKQLSNHRTS